MAGGEGGAGHDSLIRIPGDACRSAGNGSQGRSQDVTPPPYGDVLLGERQKGYVYYSRELFRSR